MALRKNIWIGSGLLTALGSTICCWGPALLAGVAGLTGTATLFSWLHPLKPYLAGIAVVSLGMAFYRVYRQSPEEGGGCSICLSQRKKKLRMTKTVLWLVTVFAMLSFGYPYYSNGLASNSNGSLTKHDQNTPAIADSTQQETLNLTVEGMACSHCAGRCRLVCMYVNPYRKGLIIFFEGSIFNSTQLISVISRSFTNILSIHIKLC